MPKIMKVGEIKDYTIVDNSCLRDVNLDIAERGLLITMLSLPDNWDFNGRGLSSILPCGKTKIYSALKKLETAGYLMRKRIYKDGRVADWEYYICGKAIFFDNTTDVQEEIAKTNDNAENFEQDRPAYEVKTCDANITDNSAPISSLVLENQEIDEEKQEMPDDNKINNNKLSKNKIYKNQSINHTAYEVDRPIDVSQKDYEKYKELIKQNIDYDSFVYSLSDMDLQEIDEIVELMTETVAINNKPVKINGTLIPAEIVKSRFLKINHGDIDYLLFALSRNTTKVKNIRAYLIAAIYNAKTTQNNYYGAEVRHDLYGGTDNV